MSVQEISSCVQVGEIQVPGRVWLAPMTGVSDLPFRQTASRLGAPYVATEMVACAEFARGRPDVVRRAAVGEGLPLMVVQLVGCEVAQIAAGVRIAAEAGAQIIDLNFGCPAKEVTGIQSGSALMRRPDLAEALVAAAVDSSKTPVTVKMRLGWDDSSRNAPEIAARAEARGARAITVHGRTRSQFYSGQADWRAVAEIRRATRLPLIVNGDIVDAKSARQALDESGADAVMIGRGAYGRPWIAAQIEAELSDNRFEVPGVEARLSIAMAHFRASLAFYGERLGLKVFRKHLAAYVNSAPWPADPAVRRSERARLCRLDAPGDVERELSALWRDPPERLAA